MQIVRTTRSSRLVLPIALVVVLMIAGGPALAGSNSTTLPNGANLTISIDDPVTSTEILIPTGETTTDVPVSGTASLGLGDPDVTLVYVMDLSASTLAASGGTCGDLDGDGTPDTILDCQVAAVLSVNTSSGISSVDLVGTVVYGETGAAADMTPAGADDPLTAPDANGDVATVVTSVFTSNTLPCPAGVNQFTPKSVGCDGTDFSAGLAAANTVVNDPSNDNGTSIVLFLSDGLSNQEEGAGFSAALDALVVDSGAIIHSVALGAASSCTGGSAGSLQDMADLSVMEHGAGSCSTISSAELPEFLPDLISTSLDSVEVEGTPASTDLALPQPGPVTVNYTSTVLGLGPGDHEICATATGSDTSGSASVTQCETIHVIQEVEIDIKPGSDPNSINCENPNGVIAVAILTTPTFDATTVDHTTVEFEGASETHIHGKSGEPKRHEEDVDHDGDIDLVLHFRVGETDLTCESIAATLTGVTFGGDPISGSDAVRMVGG